MYFMRFQRKDKGVDHKWTEWESAPMERSNNEERGERYKEQMEPVLGTLGLHEGYSTAAPMENCMEVPKKLKIELSFPGIPLLSMYLDKSYHSKRCIQLCVQHYAQQLRHGSKPDAHQQMQE